MEIHPLEELTMSVRLSASSHSSLMESLSSDGEQCDNQTTFNMDISTKTKLINSALLLSFSLPLTGPFLGVDTDKAAAIASLVAGSILTIFHREVAAERFRINQETKNRHLKEFFAGETEEGDRTIVLIVGIVFLIVGVLLSLATFA